MGVPSPVGVTGGSGGFTGPSYKTNDYIGPAAIASSSTLTTAGTAYFGQLLIFKALTINQLAVWVRTSAALSTVRLGIYNDANGRPSTLVVDAGTIDSTGTGAKTSGAISQALTAKTYWVCAQPEGGNPNLDFSSNFVIAQPHTDITSVATGAGFTYSHTGALAADVSAQTFTAIGGCPMVYVRAT